ncbi:hypothetical protein [Streptomyces subrutilus]|uniref:Uncharacterized protein n=1 Tax=Streptomyces subrutilus TaxID=36818 RepID=A0A1E5Q286_9ACTN|nr:hypothetical protein [Streptomyces subrutilus]OEJ35931.1 hypothetical protein BGK67_24785 [Streptomyces subrutilus]
MGQKSAHDAEPEKKKLDLSAAQVAGSSLATVAAALLASQMGVYGTILGAGVVSVVATAGGPVIQHFFRRTGDQIRETARPRAGRIPLPEDTLPSGEFGEATVHGTRVRGWKRTAVASGLAFAVAIGGIGAYETLTGDSVSRDDRTVLSGGTEKARNHAPETPQQHPGGNGGQGDGEPGREGNGGGAGKAESTPPSSPQPSHSPGDGGASPAPDPSRPVDPTPSPSPSKHTPPPQSTAPPAPSTQPSARGSATP